MSYLVNQIGDALSGADKGWVVGDTSAAARRILSSHITQQSVQRRLNVIGGAVLSQALVENGGDSPGWRQCTVPSN